MAGYSKVRSLVTGDAGLDTFVREVRTALASLDVTSQGASDSVFQWDSNHLLAFPLSETNTTTFRNQGSAGNSYYLSSGGLAAPRLGAPSPFGNAVEFPSETNDSSYLYGAGSFPVRANNYTVEFCFLTHFAPYTYPSWPGFAAVWKTQYFYSSVPTPERFPGGGSPASIDTVIYNGSTYVSTYPYVPAQIPTGMWNHVMFTASSTAGKRLYLNGSLVGYNSSTANTATNTNDWYLGSASGGAYKFYGSLARFAYSGIVRPQSYAWSVTKAMRGW